MLGYLLIALSVISWGLWGFTGKLATRNNHALVITAITSMLSPLASIILYILIKTKGIETNITGRSFLLIGLTALMGIFGSIFFYMALQRTQLSVAIALTALYPVITVLLSIVFLKEPFPFYKWIGLFIIIIGAILVTWEHQ